MRSVPQASPCRATPSPPIPRPADPFGLTSLRSDSIFASVKRNKNKKHFFPTIPHEKGCTVGSVSLLSADIRVRRDVTSRINAVDRARASPLCPSSSLPSRFYKNEKEMSSLIRHCDDQWAPRTLANPPLATKPFLSLWINCLFTTPHVSNAFLITPLTIANRALHHISQ